MKAMNRYFFGEEEISLHDTLWFYGFLLFSLVVMGFIVMNYIQFYLK